MLGRPRLWDQAWGLGDSALRRHPLGCVLGVQGGVVRKGMSGALGTGNKVSAALAARPHQAKAQGLSASALSLETPSLFCLSNASLPFSGLCLKGCGATFGKYQHRGFLWPCSGPSSLNLFATVCFTGPCTLTQLLTLITWLRRSDGWKPRCCD